MIADDDAFRAALDWPWIEARFWQDYAIPPDELVVMPTDRLLALLAALPR